MSIRRLRQPRISGVKPIGGFEADWSNPFNDASTVTVVGGVPFSDYENPQYTRYSVGDVGAGGLPTRFASGDVGQRLQFNASEVLRRQTFTTLVTFSLPVPVTTPAGFIYNIDSRFNITLGQEGVGTGWLGVSYYDGTFRTLNLTNSFSVNDVYTVLVTRKQGSLTTVAFFRNGFLESLSQFGSTSDILYAPNRGASIGCRGSWGNLVNNTPLDIYLFSSSGTYTEDSQLLLLGQDPYQLLKPANDSFYFTSVEDVPAAPQTLVVPVYINTQTFPAVAINAAGTVSLTVPVFINTQTFPAVAINAAGTVSLTVPVFINTQTFPAVVINAAGTVSLSVPVFINTQTFPAVAINAAGTVSLTVPVFINTQTFPVVSITAAGSVTISVPVFVNTQTFPAVSITAAGSVLVVPVYINTQIFPTVSITATGSVAVVVPVFVNAQIFPAVAVVAAGAVSITVPVYINPQFFPPVSITAAGSVLVVPVYINAQTFPAVSISAAGAVTISVPVFVNTQIFPAVSIHASGSVLVVSVYVNEQVFPVITISSGEPLPSGIYDAYSMWQPRPLIAFWMKLK